MFTKEKFLEDKIDLHIKSPESNEEYVKLIQKLIDLGWKTYDGTSAENFFYNDWIYLPYNSETYVSIHPRNNPEGKKEIQVSDIIGSQFEVGKWYELRAAHIKPKQFYLKFESENEDCYNGSYISVRDKSYFEYGNFCKDLEYTLNKLTNLLEIQQYLPEGHPDKIQVAANWWLNLKPGDKIKCTEAEQNDCKGNKYGGAGWKSNEVFTVDSVEDYKNYGIIWIKENGQDGIYDTSCAPYSEPKPLTVDDLDEDNLISEFKVGDYITILNEGGRIGNDVLCNGKTYKITEITPKDRWKDINVVLDNDYRFRLFNGSSNSYFARLATPEEIAKVTKPTFEFNKWYKPIDDVGLFFVKSKNTGYGFKNLNYNYWFENTGGYYWELKKLIPATYEEVKERLISYAKEKYPIGTKIIDVNRKKEVTVHSDYFGYYDDTQHITYGESVYLKGEWAKISSKPESKPIEVNRNVYYEVSTQEQYKELESNQSRRTIPTVEKVTNRFKASPVRKRSLPEIF